MVTFGRLVSFWDPAYFHRRLLLVSGSVLWLNFVASKTLWKQWNEGNLKPGNSWTLEIQNLSFSFNRFRPFFSFTKRCLCTGYLGGGFKYFFEFSPRNLGRWSKIFQMGWNHQLGICYLLNSWTKTFGRIDFFEKKSNKHLDEKSELQWTNIAGWKMDPGLSRCISYWTWGIFQPSLC